MLTLQYRAFAVKSTPLIRTNWDGQPSGCAGNPDYWIFLSIYATLAVLSSAITIYSMYLRLNLSTTPDFELLEAVTLYCT
jgi:hypothetical protein